MRFLNAVFWEFIQNLPVIMLFVAAVWLWARGSKRKASMCIVASAIVGACIIRFTESMKTTSDYMEPIQVTLVNVMMFGILQTLFVAYLGAEAQWSNWKTDLLFGGLAGASIAIAQGLAASGAPLVGVILHSISLAVAFSLVIVGIRLSKDKSLPAAMTSSILIVIVMTIVISIIDYGYLLVF